MAGLKLSKAQTSQLLLHSQYRFTGPEDLHTGTDAEKRQAQFASQNHIAPLLCVYSDLVYCVLDKKFDVSAILFFSCNVFSCNARQEQNPNQNAGI